MLLRLSLSYKLFLMLGPHKHLGRGSEVYKHDFQIMTMTDLLFLPY